MGELGGVQRYIYWSDRMVKQCLEDQPEVRLASKRQQKFASPTVRGFLPTYQRTVLHDSYSRPELAKMVENHWGTLTVDSFENPSIEGFAKGCGELIFGEFVGGHSDRALMYTSVTTEEKQRVGICLFGSISNYADYVAASGAPVKSGWTSSSASSVHKFLEDQCRSSPDWHSREDLARRAVQIAYTQGVRGNPDDPRTIRAWNRAFTYGDIPGSAEWFAEIYMDYELTSTFGGPEDGHDRVIIGAPLWVRTPKPEALRLYADYQEGELDRIEDKRSRQKKRSRVLSRLFSGKSADK